MLVKLRMSPALKLLEILIVAEVKLAESTSFTTNEVSIPIGLCSVNSNGTVDMLTTGTSFTALTVIATVSLSAALFVSAESTVSVSLPLKFRLP